MTYKSFKIRPGLTAIAAVIALSSTPALAQDASVPDPVTATATPDPLAPEPVTTVPESPVPEAAAATKAVETRTAVKATPKARRTVLASRSSSASSQVAKAAPASAAVPAGPAAEPPPETMIPAQAEATPVAEPAAPPPAEAAPAAQAIDMEETLPIAGAAGRGLLALAGAGLAVRRRRRRRETEEFEERQMALAEAPPPAAPEPAFARPAAPAHDPVPARAPATALPKGFDLSKFGRHVQAAYRGPTPDNPSLSLKNRLRRASFFDQQERRAAAEARSAARPAEQPAWATRKPNTAEFLFRPAAQQPAPKPEFQK